MALLSNLTLIMQQVDYTDMPVGGYKWLTFVTESFTQVIRSQVKIKLTWHVAKYGDT